MSGNLHLTGVTSDGHLWHTIRQANGIWLPFANVEGEAGEHGDFSKVACASAGILHLCGITSKGHLWHTIREASGAWSAFGDVEGQTGEIGDFVDVACAVVGTQLHVCSITSDGRLRHAIREVNGAWSSFGNVEGQTGEIGDFVSVACHGSCSAQLHVCGVTSNGRLWHTIREVNGAWSAFGDVEGQTGDRGSFIDVGITERPVNFPENASQICELHMCAVASDGHLWHTIRQENGAWSSFGDVEGQAGDRGNFVNIACSNVDDPNLASEWFPIHAAGTTTDGRLWHTIRWTNGTWQPFGDVKGQAGDRGPFVAVSVAYDY